MKDSTETTSQVQCFNLETSGWSEPITFIYSDKTQKTSFKGTIETAFIYREKMFITDLEEKTITIFKMNKTSGHYE